MKLAIIFFYRKANSTEKAKLIGINLHLESEFNTARRKMIRYQKGLISHKTSSNRTPFWLQKNLSHQRLLQ